MFSSAVTHIFIALTELKLEMDDTFLYQKLKYSGYRHCSLAECDRVLERPPFSVASGCQSDSLTRQTDSNHFN